MELKGIAASPGIAIGKVFLYRQEEILIDEGLITEKEISGEVERFRTALKSAEAQIRQSIKKAGAKMGKESTGILDAHLEILHDPCFSEEVCTLITSEKRSCMSAVKRAISQFISLFEQMEDEYMKARAADIKDVGDRVLHHLGGKPKKSLDEIREPCIVIAEDLVPSDTTGLDKSKVMGFATDIGSKTSHTAIVARALGIPAVLGLNGIAAEVQDDQEIILDGSQGIVVLNAAPEQLAYYQKRLAEQEQERRELEAYAGLPAQTLDGQEVAVYANIRSARDIEDALRYGAQGVGLFRTEFLFMDRTCAPDENEQFREYQAAAQAMGGKPIIIRTLDIGGDKELPYLGLQQERSPFLGYRAIRICLARPDIFKTQLRALLRASIYGNILIMYPMIGNVSELRAAHLLLDTCKEELDAEGIPYNKEIKVGMMIEVPSAAVMADILAKEVDFFSIGTNDLIQYTFAVDRMNQRISYLYQPLNPAVFRIVKGVIEAGHVQGIPTGMCGEVAGEEMAALVLLGLGLDEFSMSPPSILKIKKLIRSITMERAREIARPVMGMATTEEVEGYLGNILNTIQR